MVKLAAFIETCEQWLLVPVGRVQAVKRRLIFRALRSRFFFIVAGITALPILGEAMGATISAVRPIAGTSPFLLWVLVAITWTLFILTLLHEKWRLQRRSDRADSLRAAKQARKFGQR